MPPSDAGVAAAPKRKRPPRPAIGWREWIALPGLGIPWIKVKADTGARTSALHAFNVKPFLRRGERWVRFEVHPLQRNDAVIVSLKCPVKDRRWVTNSGGGRERRYVIVTPVRIGESEWPIEITLTDRDEMGFRMLLGRTAIKGRFVVDPGRSYTQHRRIKAPAAKAGKRRAKARERQEEEQ